ncbi:hypothetical protein D3C74_140810 [compost metagenome]
MNKEPCINCGTLTDYEPEYCCEGRECGCMGLPIEPPICSKECWDQAINGVSSREENAEKNEHSLNVT